MTILSSLKTYLKTYSGLETDAPVWVNFLGSNPTQYSIVPIPGEKIVESYINGSSLREYPFLFQSMESTADEAERLENVGFYEAFSDWLETQTKAGVLPTLGTNQTAIEIEAMIGYLFEQGESDRAVYQIECKLTYEQGA
jgi:hypothetical protein